jgi:hypothetical protein
MDYLLKIKNQDKAKALFQFLKNLDFVEIEKHDSLKEWRDIVKAAETSKSIPLNKAKTLTEGWKNR